MAEHTPGLTDVEQRRLADIARQPGLVAVRTLYKSWRLTKVLTLLPLTVETLGDAATELLSQFWHERRACGPYFVEECLAFLDFLELDAGTFKTPVLSDVIAFERARLNMRDAIGHGSEHASRSVKFEHDPAAVFQSVHGSRAGKELQRCPTVLRGELWKDGREHWSIDGDAGAPASGTSGCR